MIKEAINRAELEIPEHETMPDSFFYQIMRMRKAIVRRSSHLMAEAEIHLQMEQLQLLVIVQKFKTLSQRELSDITLRDKSSILRSISSLQKKELVVVEQDSLDKRKNNISLTEAGIELALTIRTLMRKAEQEVLSVFSEEERVLALQTMQAYADKLETL